MSSSPPHSGTGLAGAVVLVVDDDPKILRVVTEGLVEVGAECIACESAEDALARFEDGGADGAIVDVRLPGMDGVELASRLKAQTPDDEFIPVLLIGGRDGVSERVRGLSAGCDDFMGKPFSMFELRARMNSLLGRRAQHRELAAANAELRVLHEKKRELAALVVHDLRSPVCALHGNLQLLADELGDVDDKPFLAEVLGALNDLTARVLAMVNGLLDVEELEDGLLVSRPEVVDVPAFVDKTTTRHGARLRERSQVLECKVNDGDSARFDPQLIGRVLENLLDNAVRYAPIEGKVVVVTEHDGGDWVLRVGNNGPPVPAQMRERIFDRYHRLEARRAGARANRGLGLYFCKLAAEASGGTISVEELPEFPTCFTVRLPQT